MRGRSAYPAWVNGLPRKEVLDVCIKEAIPFVFFMAMIQTESSGKTKATRFEPGWKYWCDVDHWAKARGVSADEERYFQQHSYGLCQVMGSVLRERGFAGGADEAMDVVTNLEYGAKIVKDLLKKYTSWTDAVAAYNAGAPRRTATGAYKNQAHVDRFMGFLRTFAD